MNYKNLAGNSVNAEQYIHDEMEFILFFIYGSAHVRPMLLRYGTDMVLYENGKELIIPDRSWLIINDDGTMKVIDDKTFRKNHIPVIDLGAAND